MKVSTLVFAASAVALVDGLTLNGWRQKVLDNVEETAEVVYESTNEIWNAGQTITDAIAKGLNELREKGGKASLEFESLIGHGHQESVHHKAKFGTQDHYPEPPWTEPDHPKRPGKPGKPGKPGWKWPFPWPKPPGRPPHHPHDPHRPPRDHPHKFNATLFEMIGKSKYTSKFYDIIKDDKDIREMLSDNSKNFTVFVPLNDAFKKPPHSPHKEPRFNKDFLKQMTKYSILKDVHCEKELFFRKTLPTVLKVDKLGKDRTQRLRFSHHFGRPKVNVNLVATIVAPDFFGTNGVIHVIDHILLPPPTALTLLNLFPNQFSTTVLAIYKSGLDKALDDIAGKGLTFFPPTNNAWKHLPWDVVTFLFSKHGEKVLKALMKYHVAPSATLYSDAYIEHKDKSAANGGGDYVHKDLHTLLKGESIAVDIKRWHTFYKWTLNGSKRVIFSDLVTEDGVMQIPSGVLIPPCNREGDDETEDLSKLTVEDLTERLKPYME